MPVSSFESDCSSTSDSSTTQRLKRTQRFFSEYLAVDVTQGWQWAHTDSARAAKLLNDWISKRGDALHRSKLVNNGTLTPHLVKCDELVKAIRFVKELVKATDSYLDANL